MKLSQIILLSSLSSKWLAPRFVRLIESDAVQSLAKKYPSTVGKLLDLVRAHPAITTTAVVLGCAAAVSTLAEFYLRRVRKGTFLELDLQHVELPFENDPIAKAMKGSKALSLREVIETLDIAASDSRIGGIVVRVGDLVVKGAADIEELRMAIQRFRSAGKRTIAYTDTFGEGRSGIGSYWLASAFEEIVLAPSGDLNIIGMFATEPFIRRTLDRLGIEPQLIQKSEYKTFANFFLEDHFTPTHSEMVRSLVRSLFDKLSADVAASRAVPLEDVRRLFVAGPHSAAEALERRLVSRLQYRDDLYQSLKAARTPLLFFTEYLSRKGRRFTGTAGRLERASRWLASSHAVEIGLVMIHGPILRGRSAKRFGESAREAHADNVCEALRAAAKAPQVRAVVLHVDSPGGSYVASDAIAREVLSLKAAGKKVIVSMGNVAGSGGYFVAMNADKIIALSTTLTGSIGVINGKFVVRKGAEEHLGVTFDHVAADEGHDRSGRLFSAVHRYNKDDLHIVETNTERYYADFKQKVADGRKHVFGGDPARVEPIARGRVWTGAQAKEIGLVDEIGGFDTALEVALREIGLPATTRIYLRHFPPSLSLSELIMESMLKRPPRNSEEEAERGGPVHATVSLEGILPRTVVPEMLLHNSLGSTFGLLAGVLIGGYSSLTEGSVPSTGVLPLMDPTMADMMAWSVLH